MTNNDKLLVKAKKELLEKQINALEDEISKIQDKIEDIDFFVSDELKFWSENKKKINSFVKEALPLLEIRDYLVKVSENMEQSDLGDFENDNRENKKEMEEA